MLLREVFAEDLQGLKRSSLNWPKLVMQNPKLEVELAGSELMLRCSGLRLQDMIGNERTLGCHI